MTVTLRPAHDADRDAIADLWHLSASLPGVGPPVMPSRTALRARVDEEMTAGWQVTLAEDQGRIMAFLALKPREAILAELFVHPDWIGHGIGSRLMAQAKAALAEGFRLYTSETNSRAQAFYLHHGMERLQTDTHPRTGHAMVWYGWPGN
ncbi:GNAT family N-acetyltransferase [Thioclava sp. UBA3469]|uniref:GNAT family N-acetyltransferase n=1 Tax=Thioclava sp. UBA3469 TaxID=1947693 RepID=UPI00257DC7AB|nr:GNAT family N-acetyltransferase [Thioclava sp. UBA3469]